MPCFRYMLSDISSSRNGSLSLYHDDTSVVNDPSANRSGLNCGKEASSRFSNSDTLLRGKVLKTTAMPRNITTRRATYR